MGRSTYTCRNSCFTSWRPMTWSRVVEKSRHSLRNQEAIRPTVHCRRLQDWSVLRDPEAEAAEHGVPLCIVPMVL